MNDPNLNKILQNNLKQIQKDGKIGKAHAQASSYLDYMYGFHNRDKRKIELDQFVEKLKDLSNESKMKNKEN